MIQLAGKIGPGSGKIKSTAGKIYWFFMKIAFFCHGNLPYLKSSVLSRLFLIGQEQPGKERKV
jgi:hypothetical protein